MSSRIVKMFPELKRFSRFNKRNQRKYIKTCSNDFVKCACECAKNVIKRNEQLKPGQLKKLRRHKRALRELALKRYALKRKIKILQRGGLQPLIGYLARMEHAKEMILVDEKLFNNQNLGETNVPAD